MMKIMLKSTLFIMACLFVFAGCEEPKGPAYVKGKASINPGSSDDVIEGDLSRSGGDYYGFCEYKDGLFNFTVAHAKRNDLSAGDFYLNFQGIKGPGDNGEPVQGLFEDDADGNPTMDLKQDLDYESTFARANVSSYKGGDFELLGTTTGCKVNMFAEPTEGELIYEDERNKSFEYYVDVHCSGLTDITATNGTKLLSVSAQFYFDNC